MKITVIGIYDRKPEFSSEIKSLIAESNYCAGGKRHFELVKEYIPLQTNWFNITVPLTDFFTEIQEKNGNWIVFASGDPLFFGIGNTLIREFPDAVINVVPAFSSLQLLGHKLGINYGRFKTVSLTGRDWHEFDAALIQGEKRLGILTDRQKTPLTIAARMLEFGYDNYRMLYGERLGGEHERTAELTLQEAVTFECNHPNCFFLEKTDDVYPRKGIPETEFEILDGRPKMITKMAVRLATLSDLELHNKKVLWDIGACTGSISIEARLHYPQTAVVAFEKREESKEIITKNAQKFQAPGIALHIGDYLELNKKTIQQPDAVFLGGYSGKMNEILDDVNLYLAKNGMIVFNSVNEKSKLSFLHWGKNNNYQLRFQQQITVDEHNAITIVAIEK